MQIMVDVDTEVSQYLTVEEGAMEIPWNRCREPGPEALVCRRVCQYIWRSVEVVQTP